MKKILTVISFFIISFSFMWVAMDMSGMKSTYDGVAVSITFLIVSCLAISNSIALYKSKSYSNFL